MESDLFASKDSELGLTDVVKLNVNTGNTKPNKMRPYRTPIKNREVIDKALEEMSEVIRRSNSPLSFLVVIVDKTMGVRGYVLTLEN